MLQTKGLDGFSTYLPSCWGGTNSEIKIPRQQVFDMGSAPPMNASLARYIESGVVLYHHVAPGSLDGPAGAPQLQVCWLPLVLWAALHPGEQHAVEQPVARSLLTAASDDVLLLLLLEPHEASAAAAA